MFFLFRRKPTIQPLFGIMDWPSMVKTFHPDYVKLESLFTYAEISDFWSRNNICKDWPFHVQDGYLVFWSHWAQLDIVESITLAEYQNQLQKSPEYNFHTSNFVDTISKQIVANVAFLSIASPEPYNLHWKQQWQYLVKCVPNWWTSKKTQLHEDEEIQVLSESQLSNALQSLNITTFVETISETLPNFDDIDDGDDCPYCFNET